MAAERAKVVGTLLIEALATLKDVPMPKRATINNNGAAAL